MNKLIKQTKIYECSDYDRYIYAEYTDNRLTVLNYWQGISEPFDHSLLNNDEDLLNFYYAVEIALIRTEDTEVDRFNAAIDMHFMYKNNY
jgi:hypothetical protein